MHTTGQFTPTTREHAQEIYDSVGPTAQTVVREVAKAMEFDSAEYDERVTSDVVMTARNGLFASLLEVTVGTREEFDAWCAENAPESDITLIGSENVGRIVWHPVPFADVVVAASFHTEERAAVETLRRHAFGSQYRELLENGEVDE